MPFRSSRPTRASATTSGRGCSIPAAEGATGDGATIEAGVRNMVSMASMAAVTDTATGTRRDIIARNSRLGGRS